MDWVLGCLWGRAPCCQRLASQLSPLHLKMQPYSHTLLLSASGHGRGSLASLLLETCEGEMWGHC